MPPGLMEGVSGRSEVGPKKQTRSDRVWRHQYSDGKRRVVALRSASVMIQILVPFERL